jgi:hypothetical protein
VSDWVISAAVSGSAGIEKSGLAKSNAAVRSPVTERRHAVMLGALTPVQASRKRSIEVWSERLESTYPPRVHGEQMIIGTRGPKPTGSPPISASRTVRT